jgi:hypothetical protein
MTQAFPSPSSEEEENRNIIGKIPTCAAKNCTGWLVDSFAGKYFIKCEDPKHNAVNNDDNDNEKVEKEGKKPTKPIPTSTRHTRPDRRSQMES